MTAFSSIFPLCHPGVRVTDRLFGKGKISQILPDSGIAAGEGRELLRFVLLIQHSFIRDGLWRKIPLYHGRSQKRGEFFHRRLSFTELSQQHLRHLLTPECLTATCVHGQSGHLTALPQTTEQYLGRIQKKKKQEHTANHFFRHVKYLYAAKSVL